MGSVVVNIVIRTQDHPEDKPVAACEPFSGLGSLMCEDSL